MLRGRGSGFYTSELPTGRVVSVRDLELMRLADERRVIHIGCTDSPLTAEKVSFGGLLHNKLARFSSALLGVDVDPHGMEILQKAVPGDYLLADVSDRSTHAPLLAFEPDLIMASDVIEHVPDIGAFVHGLAALVLATSAPLVLTTPNGLAIRSVVHTLFRKEVIHPDHRVVFTPTTMARTLDGAGLCATEWVYYTLENGGSLGRRVLDRAVRASTRVTPAFADGLIVTARPK